MAFGALATLAGTVIVGLLTNLLWDLVSAKWVRSWWFLAGLLATMVVVVFWRSNRPKGASAKAIAAIGSEPGTLEIFVVSATGGLFNSSYRETAGTWTPWSRLDCRDAWDVAVVVPAAGVVECFVVTRDGDMWFLRRERGDWSPCRRLPASLNEGRIVRLSATSVRPGHREVFAVTEDHRVVHRWKLDRQEWSAWHERPLPARAIDTAACTPNDGLIELFATDSDGQVWHAWWWEHWAEWEAWGAPGTAAVAVTAYRQATNFQEMFVVGAAGDLGNRWHQRDHAWSDWNRLDAPLHIRDVAASVTSAHQLHCLTVDDEGAIWQSSFGRNFRGGWTDWREVPRLPFDRHI